MAALILLHFAPPASAAHLHEMAGAQVAASEGGTVVLAFSLTITGLDHGGEIVWDTGDGAMGKLEDGFVYGTYQGDASGVGTLSDGRPFSWTRQGVQSGHGTDDTPRPGEVVITLTYAYPVSGIYIVSWANCCEVERGRIHVVAVNDGPPEKIPRLIPNCNWLDDDYIRCMMQVKTQTDTPIPEEVPT